VGGSPFWFYGGVYYCFGDDGYIAVSAPLIRVLPDHYRVVVIHGVVYYVADDVYYRPGPDGYIVVERPAEPATPATPATPAAVPVPDSGKTTLYVPKKGSEGFVPVTLKKIDGGYLGPQGEFYPTIPPIAQLSEMYGLSENLQLERPDVYFIHVPNRDGETYTRVILTRKKGGFVGPQGEFYPVMPSVAHLAEMYGVPKVPDEEAADPNVIHVQAPKKSGEGTVDVQLKKTDRGYIGPQGEFYPEMPTPARLTEIYG
jgi:hypothetical protein